MNVVVINKEKFQNRPPVISTVLNLSNLGYNITLITVEINSFWEEKLKSKGINIVVIPDSRNCDKFSRLIEYYHFRKKALLCIDDLAKKDAQMLLWIIGGNTILCFGKSLLKYKFILQIQELHENDHFFLKQLGKIINKAESVFIPEYNRSLIYQVWYKMKKQPIVLPNKPYFLPSKTELERLKTKYKDSIDALTGKKVVIFQGHIRDITNYVKAVKELGSPYQILLVGHNHGILDKLKEIDNSIMYIEFIPAPDYLVFTSLAYVGILTYETNSINNIFCAPNKIFEYSAYGIPMLAKDIPGLRMIEYEKAGKVVNEDDVESIKKALIDIDANYKQYSMYSQNLYDNTDNQESIRKEIEKVIF